MGRRRGFWRRRRPGRRGDAQRPVAGQGRGVGADQRPEAPVAELHLGLAAQLAAGDPLQQRGAEAPARRLGHRRPVALSPDQVEAPLGIGGPRRFDPASLGGKRAILHGVGGQFVQRQGQGVGGPRIEHDFRSRPVRLAVRQPAELGGDDVADLGAAPTGGGQQGVGRRHRLQPTGEGLQEGLQRGGLARRLRGQRLHRGQHVFHPVVELGDQGLPGILRGLFLGDVADNPDEPGGVSRRIVDRQYGGAHPLQLTVFRPIAAELHFEGIWPAQALGDRRAKPFDVVRMGAPIDRLATDRVRRSLIAADDPGHTVADDHFVSDKIPFELAHPGGVQGKARAFLLDGPVVVRIARWLGAFIHGASIGSHRAGGDTRMSDRVVARQACVYTQRLESVAGTPQMQPALRDVSAAR